jgi:hypothetical protein
MISALKRLFSSELSPQQNREIEEFLSAPSAGTDYLQRVIARTKDWPKKMFDVAWNRGQRLPSDLHKVNVTMTILAAKKLKFGAI